MNLDLELINMLSDLKITEYKYSTLKKYIELYFDKNPFMSLDDFELIINSLEEEKINE